MRILVTPTSFYKNKGLKDYLEQKAEVVYNTTGKPLTEEQLIEILENDEEGFDGCIAGLDFYTAAVLEKMPPRKKVISRYGVGVERVDLQAARKAGITVTNTPGANTDSVADLTFGLILAAARKIPALSAAVKAGEWPRSTGIQIAGKTIGIIGLGAIGKGVAKRAQGFSMRVLAYDPYINEAYAAANHIEVCTLEALLKQSDVISLHIPHTEETHHMISAARMEQMKDGVILINTSRGGLIDETAAASCMTSGKISGLGLDAFEAEPPEHSALFDLPNVILTPHTGAHTAEATENMARMSIDNLFDILEGRPCQSIIE